MVQNGATKPEVYRVSTTGNPSRERVPADEFAGKGAVTALALSPDGVRVAIVAGGGCTSACSTPAPAEGASAPTTAPAAGRRARTSVRADAVGDHQADPAPARLSCTSGR